MRSKKALKEFKAYLRANGERQVPHDPSEGVKKMIGFYKEVRAEDTKLEEDGDMLLFQWGTYDWGSGPMFEIDIVRQLIRDGGDDEDVWQLHVTYQFAPSEELRALGKGNRWCTGPSELAEFEGFAVGHLALRAVANSEHTGPELRYECTG